jgi:hypothetical protein
MEEPNNAEWAPPPPPEPPVEEETGPQMSEAASLFNIYLEPGNTFRSIRIKPKFILALAVTIVLSLGFWFAVNQKVGIGEVFVDAMKKSPQYEQMDGPTREKAASFYRGAIFKGIFFGAIVIVSIITAFIGGLIYWLGVNAMGGTARYMHGVSVWVYSIYAPTLIFVIANIIVLMLKAKDDIDSSFMQTGGLIKANPTLFVDVAHSPVLRVLLTSVDLFQIFGLIIAAIGLRIVGKVSSTSAWTVVLGLKLIVLVISVAWVAAFGG